MFLASIVNRLQSAMTREVLFLLENGYCTAEDLDLAVKTSLMPRGMALGLVQRMDFSGLDMVANGLRNGSYQPAPAPDQNNPIFQYTARRIRREKRYGLLFLCGEFLRTDLEDAG